MSLAIHFGHYLLSFLDKFFFWIALVLLIPEILKKIPKWKERAERSLPHKLFWCLAGLCFFLATFQVWHEEYEKTHPGFKLNIESLMVANTASKPDISEAFVYASLSNSGAPSTADKWKLTVLVPGTPGSVEARNMQIDPNGPTTFYSNGQYIDQIDPSDALYEKTMKEPVSTGMKQVGVIWFELPLSLTQAGTKGTVYTLECWDIFGNRTAATWIEGTHPRGPLGHLPGMKH